MILLLCAYKFVLQFRLWYCGQICVTNCDISLNPTNWYHNNYIKKKRFRKNKANTERRIYRNTLTISNYLISSCVYLSKHDISWDYNI